METKKERKLRLRELFKSKVLSKKATVRTSNGIHYILNLDKTEIHFWPTTDNWLDKFESRILNKGIGCVERLDKIGVIYG